MKQKIKSVVATLEFMLAQNAREGQQPFLVWKQWLKNSFNPLQCSWTVYAVTPAKIRYCLSAAVQVLLDCLFSPGSQMAVNEDTEEELPSQVQGVLCKVEVKCCDFESRCN